MGIMALQIKLTPLTLPSHTELLWFQLKLLCFQSSPLSNVPRKAVEESIGNPDTHVGVLDGIPGSGFRFTFSFFLPFK